MRGSNGTNPAAGKRWLHPKSHARLLDDQTESIAHVMRAEDRVFAIARLVCALYNDLQAAERHMVGANRRASDAAYEPPHGSMVLA